jgi:ribosomal protein S18 acetylase RimI-like enzyme
VELATLSYLKPARPDDNDFLYEVFCTTWQDEVAALPNQNLARHVLRIQHTAQERRFDNRYPGHRRFVVSHDGERVGRFYLFASGSVLHIVDLTLLPQFQRRGVGTRLVRDLMTEASSDGHRVSMCVPRRNGTPLELFASRGFDLVSSDDLDHYFEWTPAPAPAPAVEMARQSSHSVP